MTAIRRARKGAASGLVPGAERRARMRWMLSLASSLLLPACATPDPLHVWQVRVSEYVDRTGGGDPASLRDLTDARSRRGPRPAPTVFRAGPLAARGYNPFDRSREVHGLLLGVHAVDGRPWCFFAAATLKRLPGGWARVEDVRLAAFNADEHGIHWCVGPSAPDSLARYLGRPNADADSAIDAASIDLFPRLTDRFRLSVSDATGVAVETTTQATWTIDVPSLTGVAAGDADPASVRKP